jgi:hypothetical protein
MATTINGTNGITFNDGSTQNTRSAVGFRNRIINGDMRIDQRNAGASITQTTANDFVVDRWSVTGSIASKFTAQRNAGSVTPPSGYTNYIGITSLSSYSVGAGDYFRIMQPIEGFNVSDFSFGTASALPVTLSFWVRASITGTYGGAISNASQSRGYAFTYSVGSSNTWEKKTITVSGDTSETWSTDNGVGIYLIIGLGAGSNFSATSGSWLTQNYINTATGATSVVGTNGATFYITGVQLEAGSTATDFERRPIGTELALCQRYYTDAGAGWVGIEENTTTFYTSIPFPVVMRATPTATIISSSISTRIVGSGSDRTIAGCAFATYTISARGGWFYFTCSGGNVASRKIFDRNGSSIVALSAEL